MHDHARLRSVLAALCLMALVAAQEPTAPAIAPVAVAGAQPAQPIAPTQPFAPTQPIAPAQEQASDQDLIRPRISDITRPHNVMPHLLVGIGVVAGLAGTGASDRGTRQSILNLIRDQGLNLTIADVVGGNTALVSLTASLPPFARQGMKIPVKVQAIGDSTSLRGGELLRAELRGVDSLPHAVVQGPVLVGGFSAQGSSASVQKNVSTTGSVPDGGYVIRDVQSSYYSEAGDIELELLRPSAFNATAIAAGCRQALAGQGIRVTAVDPSLVRIEVPGDSRTQEFALELLKRVGQTKVAIENPHKITIDQATGTIVVGEGVLISPCVVGLTDLTISVVDEDEISQPGPFSRGDTARANRTRIEVQTTNSDLKPITGGATVASLVQNLKTLGLTPAQLVSVFQALDAGGFLHAELEVQ